MNNKGFTLLEALIALAIMVVVMAALIPTFQNFLDANTVSERRSNALAAAQVMIEALRHKDPGSLPSSGSSSVESVAIGDHEYELVAHFCQSSGYCDADSRHIVVEVSFAGKTIYTIESVFTRLR